jgi:transcriptional regulator with XRE-family HTH domain
MSTLTAAYLRTTLGRAVRDTRLAVGWSQQALAERAGVSRQMVGRIEAGDVNVTLDVAAALCDALGLRVELAFDAPFLADRRRQQEPALRRALPTSTAGWRPLPGSSGVRSRSRTVDPTAGSTCWRTIRGPAVLLVIEVKTEIEDLSRIERTLGWYERESWSLARRLGWQPRTVTSVLALLATDANERRLIDNRDAVLVAFPMRADDVRRLVLDRDEVSRGRGLVLIDPRSREGTG